MQHSPKIMATMCNNYNIVIVCITIMTLLTAVQCNKSVNELQAIESQIRSLSLGNAMPAYTLIKISYANLTKTSSSQLADCLLDQKYAIDEKYELIPSVNIHEGDSIYSPAMVRLCNHYFTLSGHKIASFHGKQGMKYRHFFSSAKNQYTYFAEVHWNSNLQGNSTVSIKKLHSRNKKLSIDQEVVLSIPLTYGEVTDFVNSFSLSLRLFAVSTSKHNILFYKNDGTLDHVFSLSTLNHQQTLSQQSYPVLTKLNTQLAIHSSIISNGLSYLYVISTNGKNSTLRKFILPHIDQHLDGFKLDLKFSDQNWNQFYFKIGTKIYVYEVSAAAAKQAEHGPKYWYPLLTKSDNYHIILNMLTVQSLSTSSNESIKFYYNLTDGSSSMLRLPDLPCRSPLQISSSSQSQTSHFICSLCDLAYECYSLNTHSDPSASSSSKLQYTDYSKFRVPLILISLGFVVFISITRGKKNKPTVQEDNEQETFMKQLQKRDRNLYETLKKNRESDVSQNNMSRSQRMDAQAASRNRLFQSNAHEQ